MWKNLRRLPPFSPPETNKANPVLQYPVNTCSLSDARDSREPLVVLTHASTDGTCSSRFIPHPFGLRLRCIFGPRAQDFQNIRALRNGFSSVGVEIVMGDSNLDRNEEAQQQTRAKSLGVNLVGVPM